MKKIFYKASLFVKLTAVILVLMALKAKAKSVNNGGGGYIVMNVSSETLKIYVSNGDSTVSQIKLRYPWSDKELKENDRRVVKELDVLKSEGYKLVSSNGDRYETNYVLEKGSMTDSVGNGGKKYKFAP